MRRFLLSLVGAVGASFATVNPVIAQIAPGQSGTSSMHYYGGQTAWDTLSNFGTCYAVRNRDKALELVSTRPSSIEEAKTYKRLFHKQDQSCLDLTSELHVDFQMVRGAVAEGLYRKAVPVPPALAVTAAPTIDQIRNFGDAAICVAAAHRDKVRALIDTTRLGSKAEDKAISELLPKFQACIPPNAKRSLSVDTPMIRVRLAEALWKLGVTPAARGGAK